MRDHTINPQVLPDGTAVDKQGHSRWQTRLAGRLNGMLTTELLVAAYSQGIFPMAVDEKGTIGWFSPDPRAIIPLDDRFHVAHGLKRLIKKGKFQCSVNRDFDGVIRACATAHGESWISPEILTAYTALHRAGFAHSVEVWQDNVLAGGLYGVHLGGAFFGESMFHYQTDASKVALVWLVERLRQRSFSLLDTQWTTPHLIRFGACEIPRRQYLRELRVALSRRCLFADNGGEMESIP
jgi:leucyl/phenylalanyl-tRNA--protein transferase